MSQSKSNQSPIKAVDTIYTTLEPLEPSVRQRVLASVLSLFGQNEQLPVLPATVNTIVSAKVDQTKGTVHSPERQFSPVEFIQQKNPATNSQRIACFAHYREKFENQPRFARADLKSYFAKVKEPAPANYDRDFNKAVKAGWIHEDGSESYLTSRGLESVEAGFGGKAAPRGPVPKKAKATAK